MTRINVGIHPSELPSKLLLAEHREIKRIPNVIKSGKFNLAGIPEKFTLGTGHVKFFYNKLQYLLERYNAIYNECVARNFNVTYYQNCWDDVPVQLCGEYTPTYADRQLIVDRIKSKGFVLLEPCNASEHNES